jgi:hypothetical protein
MLQKKTIVISRHWHSPEITVTMTDKEINIAVSLEDFIAALATELQHPLKSITRGRLSADLVLAAEAAVEKLKEASAHAA